MYKYYIDVLFSVKDLGVTLFFGLLEYIFHCGILSFLVVPFILFLSPSDVKTFLFTEFVRSCDLLVTGGKLKLVCGRLDTLLVSAGISSVPYA